MRPMKLAIITKGFAQGNNDWCLPPLIDYVRSISDRVEIDIYALYYPHKQRNYHVFGTRVFSFDLSRQNRLRRRLSWYKIRSRLAKVHSVKPYDLIHAIWADTPATLGVQIAHMLNIPLITTLYAGEAVWKPEIGYGSLRSKRNQRALQNVLNYSHAVTCGSQFLAGIIQENYACLPYVIPFGICPYRFTPKGPKAILKGSTCIVTAASYSLVKGLDILLEAFQQLAQTRPRLMAGLHWHCIGPDPADRVIRQAMGRRIGDLPVTLHEGKPHWEMAQYYRAADIAVQSSWFESQCFAAIEPVICGTPVAGTSVGVLPKMASTNWQCATGNAAALAQLLEDVLSNRGEWDSEVTSQQAWVQQNATLDIAAEQFLSLYDQVVSR